MFRIILILFCVSGCNGVQPMAKSLPHITSGAKQSEVRRMVETKFKKGMLERDVVRKLDSMNLEYYPSSDELPHVTVRVRPPANSTSPVSRTWRLRFFFDDDRRYASYDLKEELTGP